MRPGRGPCLNGGTHLGPTRRWQDGSTADWRYVTDGGLETDLIFHHGVDLPEFAAYPLVWSDEGRALLRSYYDGYADIAAAVGAGLRLETPTWRANPDWGRCSGTTCARSPTRTARPSRSCRDSAHEWRDRVPDIVVTGMVGPRGDGYAVGRRGRPRRGRGLPRAPGAGVRRGRGAQACALTLTDPGEAIGVVRAADSFGLPVGDRVHRRDRRSAPDGTTLRAAIERVDAVAPPAYFLVNCAHPQHVLPAFDDAGPWVERIHGLRSNASTASHAELDEAEVLDEGDLGVFVPAHRAARGAAAGARDRRRLLRDGRAPRRRAVGRGLSARRRQRRGTNR